MSGPSVEPLRKNQDFLLLWGSLSVSEVGTQITQLALPLAAVLTLSAGSVGVGLLRALETMPFLIAGLPAGAWIENQERGPVMIVADLVRLLVLASVPVAFALGELTIVQLYVAALLAGFATVAFDVAYQSLLPQVLDREQLLEGNAKLGLSGSVAQVAGPGLAGLLVRIWGAPAAVGVDAATFLLSAIGVSLIKRRDLPAGQRKAAPGSLRSEISGGLSYVFKHRLLKHLAASTAIANIGLGMIDTVLIVFMARVLHLGAGLIGLTLVLGGTGLVAGAFLAPLISRGIGVGPTCVLTVFLATIGTLLAPLAHGHTEGMWVVIASQWTMNAAGAAYNITQVTLRLTVCPDPMQARMTATMRFLVYGALPVGDLLGGVLGSYLGLRDALWISAVPWVVAAIWISVSPIRPLRALPEQDCLPVESDSGVDVESITVR